MVGRARIFGKMGFTTIIHSARDHGNSSPHRFMNAPRFAEDIEAVLHWVNEPVLLYGHSVGAAAAVIVASRNPDRIKLIFFSLYRNYNRFFGILFAPMIVLWMEIFYKNSLDSISPANLSPNIDLPIMIIHGEKDQNFPLNHAWVLRDSFPAGRAELFVATNSDHSSSSLNPEYPVAIRTFIDRHLPQS
jgi:pimeloyl-ACP methyl ester carboxylesterase